MFDDVVPPKSGNTPPNLPLGEPEDMFEKTDSVSAATPSSDGNFSSSLETTIPINTALDAGVLKPKTASLGEERTVITPVSPPTPFQAESRQDVSSSYTIQTPPSALLNDQGVNQILGNVPQEAPFSGRKILVFISVILILIVLGFGSLWIYTSFIKKDAENGFTSPTDTDTNTDTTPTIPSSDTSNSTPTDSTEDSVLFGEPVDTDSDGIVDTDEAAYGTDTLNWDSDADELSDGDEVMIWKTDPRVFDSDNDGYGDGAEIKNGYSPVGPGKLFEPPTSTSPAASGTPQT